MPDLIPLAIAALVPERTPVSYDWFTYLWVVGVSLAGGLVSFSQKVRAGTARPTNLVELIGELFTSGFVGVLTFWICEWGGINQLLSAVFMGITGHMGSRVLFLGEKYLQRYIEARTGIVLDKGEEK